MFGFFGSSEFGSTWFIPIPSPPSAGGNITLLGDTSTHGGSIIDANQDGSFEVNGIEVAVDGAVLSCPIHGAQSITAITVKSYHNGRLILTENAIAGCGALIVSPDRNVEVEK